MPHAKVPSSGFLHRGWGEGLLKEGGTRRREVVEGVVGELGGKLEAFYYAYGFNDFYIILDVPDSPAMTALSLVVHASGAAKFATSVLITPEEVDQAVARSQGISYPPAGRLGLRGECASRWKGVPHPDVCPTGRSGLAARVE